jgi:vitamin D 25-hydroxylase
LIKYAFQLQVEIDDVMTTVKGSIGEDLRSRLPYSDAVLHEVLRIGNIVPGALLHTNTRPVNLGGYTIPTGTAIHSRWKYHNMFPHSPPLYKN